MGIWTQQGRIERFDVHKNLALRKNPERVEFDKLSPELTELKKKTLEN